MTVVVESGKGGGGCGCGRSGSVGGKGDGEGSCKGGREGGRKGSGQGGCKSGGRGVLIFDILLVSLHFNQTIILTISYLKANHIFCIDVFFVLTTTPRSKPTTSFVTMCFFSFVTDAPHSQ